MLIGKKDLVSLFEAIRLVGVNIAKLEPDDTRKLLQMAIVIADDKFVDQDQVDDVVLNALKTSGRVLDASLQWEVMKTSLWNELLPGRSQRSDKDRAAFDGRVAHEISELYKSLVNGIDKNFDWEKPIYMNVRPPAATGLRPGVEPEEIADPILRAQYQKAIDENEKRNELFKQQNAIKRQIADVIKRVSDWMKRQPKEAIPIVRQELIKADISADDIKLFIPENIPSDK